MNVIGLAKYLLRIVEFKQQPRSVGKAIIRAFNLDSFEVAGMDRSELTLLSNDELDKVWDTLSDPAAYNPQPDPYIMIPCYAHLLKGICCEGIKFVAESNKLQAFDQYGQVVYEDTKRTSIESPTDFRHALYFIGLADEVLHPYISEFCWDRDSVTIKLNLNEKQIQEIRELLGETPVGNRLLKEECFSVDKVS